MWNAYMKVTIYYARASEGKREVEFVGVRKIEQHLSTMKLIFDMNDGEIELHPTYHDTIVIEQEGILQREEE